MLSKKTSTKNWFDKFNKNQMPNFNMAEIFLFRLNELLYKCSEARYMRNHLLWWTSLDELFNNIAFEFELEENKEDYDELLELFKKVETYFNNSRIDASVESQSITEAETTMRIISRKINILLYKYGLLMPLQKKQRDMTSVVEDF